jgi:hypothetical protein
MADLVAGDGASVLRVTVRDSQSQEPVDLTGKAVMLRYKLAGGAIVEKTMTVLDQANAPGQAEYAFAVADLPTPGSLEYEIRLNDGLASQLTSIETGQLAVRGELT